MSDTINYNDESIEEIPIILPPYTNVECMSDNGVFNAFGPIDFIQKFFSGGLVPKEETELVLVLNKNQFDDKGNQCISVLFKAK